MTRRDFGIVFWAYLGIDLLVSGLAKAWIFLPTESQPVHPPAGLKTASLVAGAVFVLLGLLFVLCRARLADWLFAERGPAEAARSSAGSTLALDLGALAVAAIGFFRVTAGLALVPYGLALPAGAFTAAQARGYFGSAVVNVAVGVLLIASRRRIARSILRADARRSVAGTGSEIPVLGFALLGLSWAMAQVPQLVLYVLSEPGSERLAQGGAKSSLDLVTRVVYLIGGLALFFGGAGLAERWLRGRRMPPAAVLLAPPEPPESSEPSLRTDEER